MAKRVCAQPGCPTLVDKGRCQAHRIESPTYTQRDWAERKRRAAAVAAWVSVNGWTCPGWGRAPHESHDLTADHVLAVARGGNRGRLAVLCRSCNGRKQDREG